MKNLGEGSAAASTMKYLLVHTVTGATKNLNGTQAYPILTTGSSSSIQKVVTIFLDTPVGTYNVQACADSADVVSEGSETNNCTDHHEQLGDRHDQLTPPRQRTDRRAMTSSPGGRVFRRCRGTAVPSAPAELLAQPPDDDGVVPGLQVDGVDRDLVGIAALMRALLHVDVGLARRERELHRPPRRSRP